ncbi:tetratricopeptide repeat protein [Aquabacterium humicola]|uniref:tetratricopeptide repeat protein n=1 Tax=Aquabacterium humicola TaxID=3237377 RepID=UPI0025430891|nr:tetratricopeptide repeat protein [Rubrivivax pictus]
MDPIPRALLLIDVVGSTSLSQALGDVRMAQVWAAHDRLARDLLVAHDGTEIDKTDGFLLIFENARDAAAYALAYHRATAGLEPPLRARAGLHVGDVILTRNPAADVARGAKPLEVDGLAKPMTARIMALAIGGQTLLSKAAHAALAPAGDLGCVRSHGHYRLKGIDEPVELLELGVPGESPFTPPPDAELSYRVIPWQDAWRPARDIPHALPAERDEFIGRSKDLQALAGRLDAGERLVTVLGMGGSGKTRLVRRYGRVWLGDWPGGVYFCDLSEARSAAGIAYAVAAALDVPLGTVDPVVQLAGVIAGRGKCLLLLDNFEQVSAHAAATLTPWLERAPQARFVVTSREVLALPAEHVMPLEPLDIRGAGVELFAVRARSRKADFELTASNRPVIEDIVALLDGLPLAIELAAARVVALAPRQLLERLKDRFQLLVGARGAPARQATLRATIDWSWALLAPWEQAALAQASVFVGGFTLEAAEHVLDLSAWQQAPLVVDVVQSLVERSLLRVLSSGTGQRLESDEPRFGMYVSIQAYAAEKLGTMGAAPSPGETDVAAGAAARHGRYFARFGTVEALDALRAHGGAARARAMAGEVDNLVAACRRAVDRADGAVAVPCLSATLAVLTRRGPYRVGVELGRKVLALDTLRAADRGSAAFLLGAMLRLTGGNDEALGFHEQGLALRREIGDRRAQGRSLYALGETYRALGRREQLLQTLEDALSAARETGDCFIEAMCLNAMANSANSDGRMDEAWRLYSMALACCRQHGMRTVEGNVLCNMGIQRRVLGHGAEAQAYFGEAIEIAREWGDRRAEGHVLGDRGAIHLQHERLAEASADFQAALAIALDTGDTLFEVNVRQMLGEFHEHRGEPVEALGHYERALARSRECGYRIEEGRSLARWAHVQTGQSGQGALTQARQALVEAEAILREANDPMGMATLHCFFADCEHAAGELTAARRHLQAAEGLAVNLGAGAESELGRYVARLRSTLGGSGEGAGVRPARSRSNPPPAADARP